MTASDIATILQACLAPAIGLTTVYIAFQQHQLTKEKRRAELYEKRLAIYKIAKEFAFILSCGNISLDTIVETRRKTAEIAFLFGKEVKKYMDELGFAATGLALHQGIMRGEDSPKPKQKEMSEMIDKEIELQLNISDLAKKVDDVFYPYLKQDIR